MASERIIQKDSKGLNIGVLHRDRGLIVGRTVGSVTYQINSGSFSERALYEMHQQRDTKPPITQRDRAVFEKLTQLREELGLRPDAIVDNQGRKLRDMIDIMPE